MNISDELRGAIRESRALIRTRFPFWLRPFLQRGVIAITLGRRIYLTAGVAEQQLETLLRHELVHVRQVARLGVLRFYWQYVREYVSLRRRGLSSSEAYRNISFELEAVAAEKPL